MTTPEEDFNRMRWASRRGLLELDLLLAPFVESCYPSLPDSLKADFRVLVSCEDQDILNWIMGREPTSNPDLEAIVQAIHEHNRSKLR